MVQDDGCWCSCCFYWCWFDMKSECVNIWRCWNVNVFHEFPKIEQLTEFIFLKKQKNKPNRTEFRSAMFIGFKLLCMYLPTIWTAGLFTWNMKFSRGISSEKFMNFNPIYWKMGNLLKNIENVVILTPSFSPKWPIDRCPPT